MIRVSQFTKKPKEQDCDRGGGLSFVGTGTRLPPQPTLHRGLFAADSVIVGQAYNLTPGKIQVILNGLAEPYFTGAYLDCRNRHRGLQAPPSRAAGVAAWDDATRAAPDAQTDLGLFSTAARRDR